MDMKADRPDIASVLQASKPKRRIGRWLLWLLVILLVAGGGWYYWSSSDARTATTYTTEPVTVGDMTITVTATGTVEPTNTVELSSELSGTIGSVDADFNDVVKKGDALAKLKSDQLEATVALAKATLEARKADVQEAGVTVTEKAAALKRAGELLSRNINSTETYETAKAASDRAEAALAAAKANLDIAQANLDIAQSNLDKACICAPIDGVVLDRDVEIGQTVAASLQAPVLFTLAENLTEMQLQVDIDEADVGQIEPGEAAEFTVEAFADRRFPATISQLRLSPETVEGVVTYKAILSVDNNELLLRPGMTATAEITVQSIKDTPMVPNAALRFTPPATGEVEEESGGRGAGLLGMLMPRRPGSETQPTMAQPDSVDGRRTVWVLRDGEPVSVSVKVGASDGNHTAVLDGDLAAGDRVIVSAKTGS
ncbi:MAG: efflux RND transporter periplasmic adaptor subunit [Bauldia sp.]|nr:efflux RND transporter periplasmic adaptor subunit [Bauldia sp.]